MMTTGQSMRVPMLTAPATFQLVQAPRPGAELRPGEALVRVLAGGICGSDAPYFRSALALDGRSPAIPGAPLHEIVGEVVLASSDDLKPGDRVVGWATRFDGLADYIITEASSLHVYQMALPPEEAVAMQPLACVLYAVERVGSGGRADLRRARARAHRPAVLPRPQGARRRPRLRSRPGGPLGHRAALRRRRCRLGLHSRTTPPTWRRRRGPT